MSTGEYKPQKLFTHEGQVYVLRSEYYDLVKEHDANVLMLKAFQVLFKNVEPQVTALTEENLRLKEALDYIRSCHLTGQVVDGLEKIIGKK